MVQMTTGTYGNVLPGAKSTAVNQVQGFFLAETTPSSASDCSPENSPIELK